MRALWNKAKNPLFWAWNNYLNQRQQNIMQTSIEQPKQHTNGKKKTKAGNVKNNIC